MDRKEAIDLYKRIITFFPRFNNKETEEERKFFTKLWIEQIEKGDYQKSLNNLENYLLNGKYPPKISDFLVLPPKEIKRDTTTEQYEAEVKEELKDPAAVERRKELFAEMHRLINGGDHR